MINTILNKTLHIHLNIPYLATTDDKQYHTQPIDIDIIKCLDSKGHAALYQQPHTRKLRWSLAPYFNNAHCIKAHWSISVSNISRNSITQLCPSNYFIAVIWNSTVECRYPSHTDTRNATPPRAVISLPEGCSIFTPDFMIVFISSFTSKMPTVIWRFQFNPFLNVSNPLFNF